MRRTKHFNLLPNARLIFEKVRQYAQLNLKRNLTGYRFLAPAECA